MRVLTSHEAQVISDVMLLGSQAAGKAQAQGEFQETTSKISNTAHAIS